MVAGAPSFEDLADEIYAMLEGHVFVAHNVNFDFSFLRHHLKQSGFDLKEKKLCTIRMSRRVFPGLPSYSLGNLCRSLDIAIRNRHRADGDARATAVLFSKLIREGGEPVIAEMLKRSSGDQWLPMHLEKKQVDTLPSGPGVYYFHNAKGKVIYVGKAVNVKKRVASHFTNNDPERKRQHLLREVRAISCKECASELHALVLESTEIRKLWPAYNRSQKFPEQVYGLYIYEDNRGYLRLAIDRKRKSMEALYTFNMLHEGLAMVRKLVESFGLNRALCFLPPDPNIKLPAKLEGPQEYNSKVEEAIRELKKQLPSFVVRDIIPGQDKQLCLLVEKGVFRGMGYVEADLSIKRVDDVKPYIESFADNDFIRNSIYSFAEANPGCRIDLSS
jgi:DNA polymerase-3 subunit epsilon